MACLNHRPVPCREREFLMTEDPQIPGHFVRARPDHKSNHDFVASYLDGLGCPACGSFEPTEKPDAHV